MKVGMNVVSLGANLTWCLVIFYFFFFFFFQALNFLVESFGLLNDLFPLSSILDAGYPFLDLHLANVLCDVILPSLLGSSLRFLVRGFQLSIFWSVLVSSIFCMCSNFLHLLIKTRGRHWRQFQNLNWHIIDFKRYTHTAAAAAATKTTEQQQQQQQQLGVYTERSSVSSQPDRVKKYLNDLILVVGKWVG
jgi:hypothetical protein